MAGFGFDPTYLIMMVPVFLFSMWAQWMVKSRFGKYSNVTTASGKTGAQVAEIILNRNGINDVKIEATGGILSDHYAPTQKVLRLSSKVYDSSSISALGVAAHEAGHAIQHFKGVGIMKLWMAIAKPAAIISNAATWLIIIGFALSFFALAWIGFIFFIGVVFFQIITLPLEFDASNRAKKMLAEYGIVNEEEGQGVAKVLSGAAMTYVAAAAASVTQLIYFALRLGLFRRR